MTRPRIADFALVATLVLLISAATIRWSLAVPAVGGTVSPMGFVRTPSRSVDDTASMDGDATLGAIDPFRFSHQMPEIRFGSEPRVTTARGPAYRPVLALKGIIGGPPWTAMVGGVPGRRGVALLRVLDRADSLVVQSIGADSAILVGPDTVWILRLGRGRQ